MPAVHVGASLMRLRWGPVSRGTAWVAHQLQVPAIEPGDREARVNYGNKTTSAAVRRVLARRGDLRIPRQGEPRDVLDAGTATVESERPATGGVSVIVPTRNEADNVGPLVGRLEAALDGVDARVIFVDDSDDGTPGRIREVARASRLPVHLHHRAGAQRSGGLGGAVVDGLRLVESPWAVVMDGDLQHPPELVPRLVDTAEEHGCDVVVASRHVDGGSAAGLSNRSRVLVSDLSTRMAKWLFPRRLGGVSDPMSGFFLLRPAAFDLDRLRPDGFKILLEMLVRTPGLQKHEVPFVFGERHAGESKASFAEGWRFVRTVGRLGLERMLPASMTRRPGVLGRVFLFGLVGLTGIVVNSLMLWMLAAPAMLGLNYLLAAVVATQVSSTWNFGLVDAVVYHGPKRSTALRRWLGFLSLSNAVLVLRIPLLALLVTGLGANYLLANAFTLLIGFALRFSGQEKLSLVKESA